MESETIRTLVELALTGVGSTGIWMIKGWKSEHDKRMELVTQQTEASIRQNNAMVAKMLEESKETTRENSRKNEALTERIHQVEITIARYTALTKSGVQDIGRANELLASSLLELSRLEVKPLGDGKSKIVKRNQS